MALQPKNFPDLEPLNINVEATISKCTTMILNSYTYWKILDNTLSVSNSRTIPSKSFHVTQTVFAPRSFVQI